MWGVWKQEENFRHSLGGGVAKHEEAEQGGLSSPSQERQSQLSGVL